MISGCLYIHTLSVYISNVSILIVRQDTFFFIYDFAMCISFFSIMGNVTYLTCYYHVNDSPSCEKVSAWLSEIEWLFPSIIRNDKQKINLVFVSFVCGKHHFKRIINPHTNMVEGWELLISASRFIWKQCGCLLCLYLYYNEVGKATNTYIVPGRYF